jgi:DNA-binding FadR family transcriptional regulator
MPIQTVESQRLYRQIAEQLSLLIASGKFASGKRTPSERELATLLGSLASRCAKR